MEFGSGPNTARYDPKLSRRNSEASKGLRNSASIISEETPCHAQEGLRRKSRVASDGSE